MATKVIMKLDSIKTLTKNLKNIDKAMFKGASLAQSEILEDWSKGRGANSKALKKLTRVYKSRKMKSGRKGIRDLNLSGDLYRSFIVKKESIVRWALTFTKDAMGKARGNYEVDNNMMKVSKRLAEKVNRLVYKLIFPKR
jgi:hypothetical protein